MTAAFWSGERSRHIITRLVIEGDLELQTPAHLGNGDGDDMTDMLLLLDPYGEMEGRKQPLLTGASIAGAMRSYLQARTDSNTAELLFGGAKGNEKGEQSPLIVDDALGHNTGIEIREGVAINGDSRTAQNDALYNFEVWQAGTLFPLRFELVIRDQDDAKRLKQALTTALEGFNDGSITLGARKRRGLGKTNIANWRIKTFDLTCTADLLDWLEHGHEPLSDQHSVQDLKVLGEAIPDTRNLLIIKTKLTLHGSLLIRSGSGKDDEGPDMVHLHTRSPDHDSERGSVLSGTSLGGVLRARTLKIANTLGPAKTKLLTEQMFGTFPQDRDAPKRASKVIVSEQFLKNAETDLVQNRVSIDRFTGGARDTALFNEQPAFGDDQTQLTIELRLVKPEPHEIGMLLLLLKDLWTGDLSLGGESSVGRGRLQGQQADIAYHNGVGKLAWKIGAKDQELEITGSDRDRLERYVSNDLYHYFNPPETEVAS